MKSQAWAVKRYVCPVCKRKGVYVHNFSLSGLTWYCMYGKRHQDAKRGYRGTIHHADVVKANPILLTEQVQYKA